MPKWKLQSVEPDTCDLPGCRYIELWDVEQAPPRTITVVAFERICPGHATSVPVGKMLWEDGNWKDFKDYIAYQRKWFRRQNHIKWLIDNPGVPMPPQIARLTSDPVSPGSVSAPPQSEIDNMNQAYNQNREHNLWKNQAKKVITDQGISDETISWQFVGIGNTRTLTMTAPDLSIAQRNDARSAMDIQFGPGKITINK